MTIDTLELTQEGRDKARQEIEGMAYRAWERAGRPDGESLRFWHEAENEWIRFYYVPDRSLQGRRDISPARRPICGRETVTPATVESRA
jgi:hypothetical protein